MYIKVFQLLKLLLYFFGIVGKKIFKSVVLFSKKNFEKNNNVDGQKHFYPEHLSLCRSIYVTVKEIFTVSVSVNYDRYGKHIYAELPSSYRSVSGVFIWLRYKCGQPFH